MNISSSHEHCPDCSAVYFDRMLQCGEELLCRRCGKRLKKYYDPRSLQRTWALITASLIFLVMANITPIMVFNVSGNTQSNLIITGVTSLSNQGYWPLALLVFFSAILLPTFHLCSFWYLLGSCVTGNQWPGVKIALKTVEALAVWNLIPVFAVATMAAVVKLDQLGTIEWKIGAFWIAILALSSLVAMRSFDKKALEHFLK